MKPPLAPPSVDSLIANATANGDDRLRAILMGGIRPTVDGKYRHWDTLRQLTPPDGLTREEWWLGIKLARGNIWHELPLTDRDGHNFGYCMPDPAYEMTHVVDRQASGEIAISEVVTSPEMRNRYIVSSLIEEAITSSQLEGASTSRAVAKEMLRSGRPPRDRSERMIVNNYRAMNIVRGWKDEPLIPDRVLQLHRVVTDGTLDNPDAAGRLQRPDEARVRVFDRATGELRHTPPPAEQMPARLEAMCKFANDQPTEGFLHPVIRSILLHFWLAYDHPFEDGNGRTARAIFYWSMLTHGYWLTEFLSISTILKRAPGHYAGAFLYTETDGLDTTYFVLNQLKVICRAIDELHAYLAHKARQVRETEKLLRQADLNHRQIALLSHALRHPDAEYTFRSHQTSHGVVYQSARTDLLELEQRGLLERRTVGQRFVFRPVTDLAERLADG
ncbi:MAG: Fic family protein [Chloroflexota bacterium]